VLCPLSSAAYASYASVLWPCRRSFAPFVICLRFALCRLLVLCRHRRSRCRHLEERKERDN